MGPTTTTTVGHEDVKSRMDQFRPGEYTPSEIQNHELQRAHTLHKDEGVHPKQPLEDVTNSKWGGGCNASNIRTTALALSHSAAEYAYPVWARLPHASKLDPELNDACRSIAGCLRATNVE